MYEEAPGLRPAPPFGTRAGTAPSHMSYIHRITSTPLLHPVLPATTTRTRTETLFHITNNVPLHYMSGRMLKLST